jgi:hypothetical protein
LIPGKAWHYLLTAAQEEAVTQFHDVGFVDSRHFAALVTRGVIESEFGDAARLFGCDDLEAFHHTLQRPTMD